MTKWGFSKIYPNPDNLMKASKITRRILSVEMAGDEIIVEFEGYPTATEIGAVKTVLARQGYTGDMGQYTDGMGTTG